MIKSAFTLILLTLLMSCTMSRHKSSSQSFGVDLENEQQRQAPSVENSSQKQVIGPNPTIGSENNVQAQSKEPVLALVYPDQENVLINAIKLQRELRKIRIQPRVFAGVGLGAAIATAFSFDMTPDEIEWELFALERKGAHRIEEKAAKLIEAFEKKDISQSFHVLNVQTAKGVWVKRGLIYKILAPHLKNKDVEKWELRVPLNKFDADIVHVVDQRDTKEQIEIIKKQIEDFRK